MGEKSRCEIRPEPAVRAPHPHRAPTATTAAGAPTARPADPVSAQRIAALQRAAGNGAVARLIGLADSSLPVQRQPAPRTLPPRTQRWHTEEPYKGRAVMRRTTTIEATAWAEVGPAQPRISYRREVELQTTDGITVYLDIRGTVLLPEGTALPSSPDAALDMPGLMVRSQRTTRVDGGDVIAVNEYAPLDFPALSFGNIAKAVMPGYAQLPLTTAQQETAILAYLQTLPRRAAPMPTDADSDRSTAGIAADIGTDFLPIIGELKDLYRAVMGTDPVTGEKLKWWERALAFIGAIPLVGKLTKGLNKAIKFFGRGFSWLRGKGGTLIAWFTEKIAHWRNSRKAKRLAKAQSDARRLASAEGELKRLAEAERLARVAAPTLAEVQKLVPAGTDWMHWGVDIFGQGPAQALERIGTRSAAQLEAIGVNRHVAQALRNFYAAMPAIKGGATRVNRIALLDHIIGLF